MFQDQTNSTNSFRTRIEKDPMWYPVFEFCVCVYVCALCTNQRENTVFKYESTREHCVQVWMNWRTARTHGTFTVSHAFKNARIDLEVSPKSQSWGERKQSNVSNWKVNPTVKFLFEERFVLFVSPNASRDASRQLDVNVLASRWENEQFPAGFAAVGDFMNKRYCSFSSLFDFTSIMKNRHSKTLINPRFIFSTPLYFPTLWSVRPQRLNGRWNRKQMNRWNDEHRKQ